MWVKKASNDSVALIGRRQHDLRDRQQRLGELRVLHVLQHHALGALFADDALVVRQVERRGLDAAVAVAGGVDLVDDGDRRQRAELRVAVLRIDRQVVLDVLQLARRASAASRSRPRSCTVMYASNAGLVVEQLVLVHLVGPDRRLDRAFQLHPRDVAVVVVVRQERVGALGQKGLERRLGRPAAPPRAAARRRAPARPGTRRCTARA